MKNKNRIFTRYIEDAELKRLFKTIAKTTGVTARRDLAWLKILRLTGIRIGAFSQLTTKDAKLAIESKRLYLSKEIQKTNAQDLFITNEIAEQFKELLVVRKKYANASSSNILIFSRNNKALSIRSYQDRLKIWIKLAGINPAISIHWLRHTLAISVLENSTANNPLLVVSDILNHQDLNFTAKIYGRTTPKIMEQSLKEGGL